MELNSDDANGLGSWLGGIYQCGSVDAGSAVLEQGAQRSGVPHASREFRNTGIREAPDADEASSDHLREVASFSGDSALARC
jgi:hypothetical protein